MHKGLRPRGQNCQITTDLSFMLIRTKKNYIQGGKKKGRRHCHCHHHRRHLPNDDDDDVDHLVSSCSTAAVHGGARGGRQGDSLVLQTDNQEVKGAAGGCRGPREPRNQEIQEVRRIINSGGSGEASVRHLTFK